MKKILKPVFIACAVVFSAATFTSCGEEDNTLGETGDEKAEVSNKVGAQTASLTAAAGSVVNVKVSFFQEEGSKTMRRLYVTQNQWGSDEGTVAYDIEKNAVNVDTKSDGSFDLNSDEKKDFTKTIPLSAPAVEGGVTVYKFWATNGRGDLRDVTKRNVYDSGTVLTVTITAGTANVGEGIKTFSAKILAAPLADGTSKSFMSVYNGQTYSVKNDVVNASLWDFGYYYGSGDKASFKATNIFSENIVDVSAKSGIPKTQLNGFYIKKGSSIAFENATAEDLKGISTPLSNSVSNLKVGDVCEFQDAYGAKGLIKVTTIVPGNGNDGKITFTVKTQNNPYQG